MRNSYAIPWRQGRSPVTPKQRRVACLAKSIAYNSCEQDDQDDDNDDSDDTDNRACCDDYGPLKTGDATKSAYITF